MLIHFSRVPFLLTLIVNGMVAAPTETDNLLSSKMYDSRANEVHDSPLERVHVNQEIGFDGRVRSIRFSFESEQDVQNKASKQRLLSSNYDNAHPIQGTYSQNIGLPMMPMIPVEKAPRDVPSFQPISSTPTELSRAKRETGKHLADNEVGDLEGAETIIFRPLFVHRQQDSRRFKLKNDKQSTNGIRREIVTQTKPRSFRRYYYYYPYTPAYTYFLQ